MKLQVFLFFLFATLLNGLDGYTRDFVPGALYVKFRPDARKTHHGGVTSADILSRFGAYEDVQAFTIPAARKAGKMSAVSQSLLESIASIRLVRFSGNLDMEYVARKLSALPDVEYAEPVYVARFHHMPNDPFFNPDSLKRRQDYLNFIHAPEAWDIAVGDTLVVIAIVDSGTDWNHSDLRANLWTNQSEKPGNNLDDDENGFVDDVHGWDFVGSVDLRGNAIGDNDPTSGREAHGTHVAGIAAAATDNGIGVASLSYNVRYMPVKVSPDDGEELTHGYEGIMYAVANGADIINCSWGSPQYSRVAEEIIKYALSMNVIIVSSAGNDGADMPFYPSAFFGVMCVATVDLNGKKSFYSNYGPHVDISAPGALIYSTVLKNSYEYYSGTSMAAPVVSALAALIKSAHKDWDADRIKAQIKGTASPVTFEDSYSYLYGSGYINAEKALGSPVLHIEIADYRFTDHNGNNDGIFSPGETIEASITLKNTGEDTENVAVSFTSLAGFLAPAEKSVRIGSLNHLEEKTVTDIRFIVKDTVSLDSKDFIRLDFESSGRSINFATIDVALNPSYATFTANTIELSVNGMGDIGYVDFPENTKGSPFIIRKPTSGTDIFNVPLLFEGGLLIAADANRVSDSIRGADQAVSEADFVLKSSFLFERAPDGSLQKGKVTFSDDGAGANKYSVSVGLEAYAYNETGHDQYIILSYTVTNEGTETLGDLRTGLFFDFDVPESDGQNDYAFFSEKDGILIIAEDFSDRTDKLMLGAAVLGAVRSVWTIDNASTDSTYFGIYDGFTDSEKWRALSAGTILVKPQGPSDVSMVISPEEFTLTPGENNRMVFIIAYGVGYDDLKTQIDNARVRASDLVNVEESYDITAHPSRFPVLNVYPNPFNSSAAVRVTLHEATDLSVSLYDILGRRVKTIFHGWKPVGAHEFALDGGVLSSGMYFVRLETRNGFRATKKIAFIK